LVGNKSGWEGDSSLLIADRKNENLKMVLVSKEKLKKAEREIWQRINQPKAELCYIFEKRTGEFWVN